MQITRNDIISLRLAAQFPGDHLRTPASVVDWMGAMQAQEYDQAKWAIGSRLAGSTIAGVERAIENKSILRTWLFRGTLHFVSKKDVHSLLSLLAPGIRQKLKTRHVQLGLKENEFDRLNVILLESLKGGKELSRAELTNVFNRKGIDAKGERLYHILLQAALQQIICCGAKKDTFRLLEKNTTKKSNEDTLKEIGKKYFLSHGPATDSDFATWAGITLKNARHSIEANTRALEKFEYGNNIYWCSRKKLEAKQKAPECLLLAGFDEFYLGYKDKSISADNKLAQHIVQKNGIFNPTLLINGMIEGIWKRTFQKEKVVIEISPFEKLNRHQKELIAAAADQFGKFLNKQHDLKF